MTTAVAQAESLLAAKAYRIPSAEQFGDEQFLPAVSLEALANSLIKNHEPFHWLRGVPLTVLWKQKGGKSGGSMVLGKCQKPSGLLAYFAETQFVIWLAADNIRALGLDAHAIEGVLFHELCHCDYDTTKDGEIVYTVRNHDWSGFAAEIEQYGLYLPDMHQIDAALHQMRLPGA